MNRFRARGQLSNGIVECFNGKAGVTTRKASGFRTCEALEMRCIILLAACPNPNSPTDSADEADGERVLSEVPRACEP